MNLFHRRLCRSEKWKRKLDDHILPFALKGVDLGDNVLEIGSGPGLTTELPGRILEYGRKEGEDVYYDAEFATRGFSLKAPKIRLRDTPARVKVTVLGKIKR